MKGLLEPLGMSPGLSRSDNFTCPSCADPKCAEPQVKFLFCRPQDPSPPPPLAPVKVLRGVGGRSGSKKAPNQV